MTCIVGMVDNKKVILGGDSAGVGGLDVMVRKDPKVFKNGDFIIGCTTSFRMIQLLQHAWEPPELDTQDIPKFMCTSVINSMRKCFDKGGFAMSFEDGKDKGGTFLVGYKGRLFKIDCDFQVGEAKQKYDACGCGQAFALGSLFTTKTMKIAPKERLKLALKAAVDNSGGVRPPFVFKEI